MDQEAAGVLGERISSLGAFLPSIVLNAEESFRNGDILRVQLRVRQEQAPDGDLRTEYIAEKVLEHIPRDRAIQIPMSEPPESLG